MADLTTLENVKGYLKIADDDTSEDTTLERLIAVCSMQFEKETQREFTQAERTDSLVVGPGSSPTSRWIPQTVPIYTPILGFPMSGYRMRFNLLQYPWITTSTTTVVLDGTTIAKQATNDPSADGWYIHDADSGVMGLAGFYSITPGISKLSVTYTAGYDPIPADIEQAVIDWVNWKFQHERNRLGQLSASMQGEAVSYSQWDKPLSVANVIDQYRRKTIS